VKLTVPVRRSVKRMRAYHPPLKGRAGKLRLDFNENTVGCSPAVRHALARLTPDQVAMYPEYESAERRLARFFRVRPRELLLTNGTDDALRLVLDTFVEPASAVLLVEPTFAMYRFYAELAGARIFALRYDEGMRFPMDQVLEALRGSRRGAAAPPRVMFLANPNNPTGTLVAAEGLRQILEAARKTLVVVDEAYYEFSGVAVLPWIRRYANLIVTRTFSKAAGLAGLRVGCLFAGRGLAEVLRKAHSPYSVNAAGLVAAEAATRATGFIRRYAEGVKRTRGELERALARLGIPAFPSAANFILVDFGRRAPGLLRGLRRQGILLRDRQSDFGRVGYVRITVGTRAQTRRLIRALERLC
jgi:histidinol-phosphate aminotransferase